MHVYYKLLTYHVFKVEIQTAAYYSIKVNGVFVIFILDLNKRQVKNTARAEISG